MTKPVKTTVQLTTEKVAKAEQCLLQVTWIAREQCKQIGSAKQQYAQEQNERHRMTWIAREQCKENGNARHRYAQEQNERDRMQASRFIPRFAGSG